MANYPYSIVLKQSFHTTILVLLLPHWGWLMPICVGNLTIIGSDNGLSPDQYQAIIWTNAGILLIGTLGTNFNGILIKIHQFSLMKMYLKILSAKFQPFGLGLKVLRKLTVPNWQHMVS